MDISTHPVVIVASTLGALVTVATFVWGLLVYLRKRFIAPIVGSIARLKTAVELIPSIQLQLFPNEVGGLSLRDEFSVLSSRLGMVEGQTRGLLQQSDMAIFITDKEGLFTWVNRVFCHMFGVTNEECMGNNWRRCISTLDRANYLTEWHECIKDSREFSTIARFHTGHSNKLFPYRVVAFPQKNGSGFIGFIEPEENSTIETVLGEVPPELGD